MHPAASGEATVDATVTSSYNPLDNDPVPTDNTASVTTTIRGVRLGHSAVMGLRWGCERSSAGSSVYPGPEHRTGRR